MGGSQGDFERGFMWKEKNQRSRTGVRRSQWGIEKGRVWRKRNGFWDRRSPLRLF